MDVPRPKLVSVVIPTWNRAKTLSRAIDSVLAQTYPTLELIISDNASTDETPSLIESYCRRDSRVRYLRSTTNRGPVKNWIYGISAANADLVKVLFSDDVLAPNYINVTASLWAGERPPRFAYTGFGFDASSESSNEKCAPRVVEESPYSFLFKSLVTHGDVPVSLSAGLFLKKDLLKALQMPILPPAGAAFDFLATGVGYDQAVYLYAAAEAEWIACIPSTLVHFGTQADSISIATNRRQPGSLMLAYLWAQLRFIERSYQARCITRLLLSAVVRAQIFKHNIRHHSWIVKMLPIRV